MTRDHLFALSILTLLLMIIVTAREPLSIEASTAQKGLLPPQTNPAKTTATPLPIERELSRQAEDQRKQGVSAIAQSTQPMEYSVTTHNRDMGVPEITPTATSLPTICSSSVLRMFEREGGDDSCNEEAILIPISYIDDDYDSTYRKRDHQNGLGTCTVSTTADSGTGSLRECLESIAQNGTISFDPNVFPPSTPATIAVSSSLPLIIRDGITIDGTGAGIILDGSNSDHNGLVIMGAKNVTIKGLQIINFPHFGVIILSNTIMAENNLIGGPDEDRNIISGNRRGGILIARASNNVVQGNYIGTNADGSSGEQQFGVFLDSSDSNTSLKTTENEIIGNLISGNTEMGIGMQGPDTTANKVLGNLIGTTADGTQALGNNCVGIGIVGKANQNLIGDGTEAGRNVISGNAQAGIDIRHSDTKQNQVLGNYIGTNWLGTEAVSNRWGVVVLCEAEENEVGNGTAEGRNTISGNSESGVQFQEESANNSVQGNYIGTDKNGTSQLPNSWGVTIARGAHDNLIGGTSEGQGNIISGNEGAGIELLNFGLSTFNNQIQGNLIGIAANGIPLGNGFAGVHIFYGATSNTIGPTNTIAHNADAGVRIEDDPITEPVGNTITQNAIHNNDGLPIDFTYTPLPIEPPILKNWSTENIVQGTACAGCKIELFANPDATVAGTLFLTDGTANQAGNFTITLPSPLPPEHACLSATTTKQDGTTSEFSNSLCKMSDSPPTPIVTHSPTASNQNTATLYLPLVLR